ncbi:hypothetical protein AMTR_s00123p00050980 [Amborella trichopoda]|uniref:Pectinesterase n=2 Tax=Amborella trichopoda TaxID=13333 RepID=W1NNT4_AMBTC|nr:hypothetical protein AMTR_s00123p00050980 [Amborella trichopoda]
MWDPHLNPLVAGKTRLKIFLLPIPDFPGELAGDMQSFKAVSVLLLAVLVAGNCGFPAKGDSEKKRVIDSPLLSSKIPSSHTIKVDLDGDGDFKSVQEAVDSVPEGNSDWVTIHVRAGVYREKVIIPEKKPYIFLRGNGKGKTWIVWNDSGAKNETSESATFAVYAPNFIAWGISFKNDAAVGTAGTPFNQSVAALVGGDKSAFYHCGFYSSHNTLFDYKGRHFYESCYIQGSIDFIFGRGQSLFLSNEVFVLAEKRSKIHGSITSQNRQGPDETSGFVFLKGRVYGVGYVYLGRVRSAHARVIFAKTYLSKTIVPEGWSSWSFDGSPNPDKLLYGEYKCHGPGSDRTFRATWSRQLNDTEVAPFLGIKFINGKEWLPIY